MAIDLDGDDQYINIPDNALLDQVAITVEMWIYIHTLVSGDKLISRDAEPSRNWQLGLSGNAGAMQFLCPMPNTWDINIVTSEALSVNTWHHVAFVAGDGAGEVFVDFASVGTDTGGTDAKANANPILIGSYQAGAAAIDAVVCEVRYWKVKRTLAQLRTNAHRRIAAQPDLIGYWLLSRQIGNIVYDRSGNGLNGTLVNSPSWVEGYSIPLGAGPLVL